MKTKVLFFTVDRYIDCHYGSSNYFGYGIYIENSNFLIFFNKTNGKISINTNTELINATKKLFSKPEIIRKTPEIEEKVTTKTVGIQELEESDPLFSLIQELKELIEKEKSIEEKLINYFPKDEKKIEVPKDEEREG